MAKFIIIILRTDKLSLPPKFAVQHGKTLSDSVTLKPPSGSEWKIRLKRRGGKKLWLCEGWSEFVDHYSIEMGHALVFKYKGDSVFKVDFFDDDNEYVDDYPPKRGKGISKKKREENERAVPIRCLKASIVHCNRPLTMSEIKNCMMVIRNFVTKKPHFQIVMQPSYVTGSRMTLPKSFVREHMRCKECNVMLRRIWDGTSWAAKFVDGSYKTNRDSLTPKFFGGWKNFARDNDLDVGDVCVFVLDDERPIDRSGVLFGVIIYRAK